MVNSLANKAYLLNDYLQDREIKNNLFSIIRKIAVINKLKIEVVRIRF